MTNVNHVTLFAPTLALSLLSTCATFSPSKQNPVFTNIILIEATGPSLKQESMPDEALKINADAINQDKLEILKSLIQRFNDSGDMLINDVFHPIHGDRKFNIQVIATSGVPAPYDAWTAKYLGVHSIFFNLSQWETDNLHRTGPGVLRHEVTHMLLEPVLTTPEEANFVAQLEHIVINEGVAHFIGYSKDRTRLLTERAEECKNAELDLNSAGHRLRKIEVSSREKTVLLKRGNTGPFWKKYAAIAGMCKAAKAFDLGGANSLSQAIKKGSL